MLHYNFIGVDGFKEKYGTGNKKKKILLAYAKSQMAWKLADKFGNYDYINIADMDNLKFAALQSLRFERFGSKLDLCGYTLYSEKYNIDDRMGVCEDGDVRSVRYYNVGKKQTFKMKAGKFFREVALECSWGQMMPSPVLTWLCEEFARDWIAYASQFSKGYQLHYGGELKDFERIYSTDDAKGDFGSCMMDDGYHNFYYDCVAATAAWLEDKDGDMVARCVIFNEAYDQDGKIWRLAERQYSSNGDETLKVSLVNALIQEGLIDGYKRVGADCHDERNFIDINGNSLRDKRFHISCQIDYDYTHVSYQDSFKYYDYDSQTAYNHKDAEYTHTLQRTDGTIEDDRNWDEYHHEYTRDCTVNVYYDGRWITCSDQELDDFEKIDDAWYHHSYVSYCDKCDAAFLTKDGYHSKLTGEDYCCESCRREEEERYAAQHNMVRCEDTSGYENVENVSSVMKWDGWRFNECYYTTSFVNDNSFASIGNLLFDPDDLLWGDCFEEACRISGIKITQNI
jgi:hypothetical protein